MTVNFAGHLYNDAGAAINGASVKLLETGTDTQEGSTVTTDSDGVWAFAEADQDRYDVEITSGSSVRRIRWDDQISLKELDARNNTGATTPAATFSNITDAVANQVAVFSGANATRADNDEIYLSFKLADSAGNLDEFARMTVVATDVTSGSEDGQFEFDVLQGGSLIKAFTIASSTAGAQSIDFNQDSITFGTGTAATDITLTFDAESADGVITWMEDEDYFKFSDDILMNSTERINFYDTAIYIYSSTDGQLDLVADTEVQIAATTIDINGAVALNGAITGATDITLSGELDAATLDISGNADIDGTTNLDAVDIDGAVQIDATFTSGVDGQGYDTKFFGDTASAYILWDTSADKLLTAGDAAVDIVKDKLLIGGTAVTTTAAELNVLDNVTAGTVTASLAVVVDSNKDIGTFRNLTIDGVFTDGNYTFDTSGNVSGLGTVASGAITSSGIIKTGDTTPATDTTDGSLQTDGGLSVALDAVIGDDVFLLSDSAVFNMGAGSDFTITHDGTTGATLAGNPITITSAAAATWSTSAGVLTIDGDDGIVLQTTGSGDITSNDNVVLVDSAKLSLGTGSDSQIYYDGTDTFWDLSAAGTGDLMVASAGSFPSPDPGTAHFWWGSAGSVASKGDVGITIEAASTVMLQFLSPDASSRSIYFGEASDSDAGAIAYNSAVSDGFHWRTAGANSMTLTGGATPTLDFLGAATISTSSGDLTLDPAGALMATVVANTYVGYRITDGSATYYEMDTRTTAGQAYAHRFDAANPTIASASNSTYALMEFSPYTLTLTGTTQVTSLQNQINIESMTITDSSAVTVDIASTLRIAGAPSAGGSVTITSPLALLVDGGDTRMDGALMVGAPSGGMKTAGTINAVAVYDDNSILTDWVFEEYYGKGMELTRS